MAGEFYRRDVLENGITVVTEKIPYLRSVALGTWIKTGSANEDMKNNGVSHFLEHLAFKGTNKRSAYDIAVEIDSIGGQIDAYTSREYTAYTARILDEHVDTAVDILSDILLNSSFDKDEIEKERDVILEEIKMLDDTPTDYMYDLFYKNVWADCSLAMPIQGSAETVNSLFREDIIKYKENRYFSGNIIICAAGNLEHDNIVDLINNSFTGFPDKPCTNGYKEPTYNDIFVLKYRDLEQVHFYLGLKGIKSSDEDRYKIYLLNIILGGSMSSRLFQKVREEQGLVYSIYSFNNLYKNTGLFGIYGATSPDKLKTAIEITVNEVKDLTENEVTNDILTKAKDQLKGNILLSLESSSSRMNQLARQEMYFKQHFNLDMIYNAIEKVTVSDIHAVAKRLFDNKNFSLTALGRVDDIKISKDILKV